MAVNQTLSLTESNVNNSANTSKVRILWQSTQTGDSWNGYTKVAKYYVSINGGAEKEYSVSYTLPKATTKTIVDTTITVTHNANGTGSVKVRTWMDTGINAGVVEKNESLTLTSIPRASTISYVSNVTLGNICTVRWTPLSKSFRYKIKFSVGDWSLTTVAIHPNITTLYTNASYGISLEAAHQFPNSKDADMTVSLYTYSDEGCTKQVGDVSTANAKVYIPEDKNTLPTVAMSLLPVSSLGDKFDGLYIQGKTKVKASFTGSEAKYSASISSYSMTVGGLGTYSSPYQSDLLSKSGTIFVKGTAKDSRGCLGTATEEIAVIPYSKPILIPFTGENSIICKRCDSEGNLTSSGTYLRIKVGRKYSKVTSEDGVQKNFCLLRFKYKVESAAGFSSWVTLLEKDNTTTNEVDAILENVVSSKTTSYIVKVEAVDDIGESVTAEFTIPTDQVAFHLKKGGKGAAFGKYAETDNCVEVSEDWVVDVKGKIRANHIAPIDSYSYKDFNELVYQTGYYGGTSAPSSASCTNYPINETGVLEVISTMVQNSETLAWWGFAYQTYRTHTGLIYVRSYFSSTGWTEWKKVSLT